MQAIEKGRVIYAGIQKFVSFIMSVHFAEVLQILLCIVCSTPVMRQPLQILFLILVTDLPYSIALGFEPGEALTMKRNPRPKSQPVVTVWMWHRIVVNGVILCVCNFCTYMLCLWAYAGAFATDDIKSIRRARTVAFISLVWAEGFHAYSSRSFEDSVWMQTSRNSCMNYAFLMVQVTLVLALFIPGLNTDVLGLYVYEIQGFGWFLALIGALCSLFSCEVYKSFAAKSEQVRAMPFEEEASAKKYN